MKYKIFIKDIIFSVLSVKSKSEAREQLIKYLEKKYFSNKIFEKIPNGWYQYLK